MVEDINIVGFPPVLRVLELLVSILDDPASSSQVSPVTLCQHTIESNPKLISSQQPRIIVGRGRTTLVNAPLLQDVLELLESLLLLCGQEAEMAIWIRMIAHRGSRGRRRCRLDSRSRRGGGSSSGRFSRHFCTSFLFPVRASLLTLENFGLGGIRKDQGSMGDDKEKKGPAELSCNRQRKVFSRCALCTLTGGSSGKKRAMSSDNWRKRANSVRVE